jgi:anthranilate synthase/aminodeoxychorismate synthase-like glutamine amidotransferase
MNKKKSLLIIDNYDSFTFNLVHQIARMIIASDQLIETFTGFFDFKNVTVTVKRNDEITIDHILEMNLSGIVISPGPRRPEDSGITLSLLNKLRDVFNKSPIPILGVCLGHQAIVIAEGGIVEKAQEPMHGLISEIIVTNNSHPFLNNIPPKFSVARYHSLIAKSPLPDTLEPLAYSQQHEVMAMAHRHLPWWSVQFHPESFLSTYGDVLIRNFLAACQIIKN